MTLMTIELKQRLLNQGHKAQTYKSAAERPVVAKLFLPDTEAAWYVFHAENLSSDMMLYGINDIKGTEPNFFILSLSDFELMKGPMQCDISCEEFSMITFGDLVAQRPERFSEFIGG